MSRRSLVAVGALFLIALGVAVRVLTVSNTPADWLDSVQVAEVARPIVSGGTWSANLLPDTTEGNGPWAFYWLGSGMHEAAYLMFGRDGVRLVGVAFLFLVAMLAWKIAGPLGALVAFSFAPLVQSVCYGRVDAVAIAFILAGVVIKGVAGQCDRTESCWKRDFLVGVCAAIAIMSWFTAIFALPVLMQRNLKGFATMGIGFLVAILVLWFPFYGSSREMLSRFHLAINSFGGMEGGAEAKLRAFLGEFSTCYGFLVMISGILLWKGGHRFLFVALLAFALVCLMKRAYVFRSVYFLPYIVVAVGGFGRMARNRINTGCKVLVGTLSLAMYAQTVCLWGAKAWITSNDRNYRAVEVVMEKEVGRDVGIFLDSYQLYYVGRDLGWRQYCTWCAERKGMDAVLGRKDVEYYIGNGREPDIVTRQLLEKSGFAQEKILVPVDELAWDNMHWWRMGPYNLWKKK